MMTFAQYAVEYHRHSLTEEIINFERDMLSFIQ